MTDVKTPPVSKALAVFTHGRKLPIFLGIFAAVLFGVAGFVLYLSTILPEKTLKESTAVTVGKGINLGTYSNLHYLYGAAAFVAVIGLIVLVMCVITINLRKNRFELHEDGVVHNAAGKRSYTRFADIQDLYLFAGGQTALGGLVNNFAYRTSPDKEWVLATGGIKGFFDFMDEFRSRCVEYRMPVVEQKLADGGKVTFRYLNSGQVYKKRFFGGFLKIKTQELTVSAEGLHVDGVTFRREDLQSVDLNDWTEKVAIKDKAGKTVFSCMSTGILSSDVFVNMIYDQIGQAPQPA